MIARSPWWLHRIHNFPANTGCSAPKQPMYSSTKVFQGMSSKSWPVEYWIGGCAGNIARCGENKRGSRKCYFGLVSTIAIESVHQLLWSAGTELHFEKSKGLDIICSRWMFVTARQVSKRFEVFNIPVTFTCTQINLFGYAVFAQTHHR